LFVSIIFMENNPSFPVQLFHFEAIGPFYFLHQLPGKSNGPKR